MRRTRFDRNDCPVARTTDLLGDWWTPLVLRELLLGNRRFSRIQSRLGMSRAVLATRLRRLEEDGVVERRPYQEQPLRHEYHLTAKGRSLWEVIVVMWEYGDSWLFDEGARIELIDSRTGDAIRPRVIDESTGRPLDLETTRVRARSRS